MSNNLYGRVTNKQIRKDTEVIDKKIYGLQFPLQQGNRGYLSKQSGLALVRNNLIQLLSTERGERVMLPNFGVSLKKYLFQPLDAETFRSLQGEIITSVSRYMPNITILKLAVINNEGIGYQGVSGFKISLVAELNEFQDNLIEVEVKIG